MPCISPLPVPLKSDQLLIFFTVASRDFLTVSSLARSLGCFSVPSRLFSVSLTASSMLSCKHGAMLGALKLDSNLTALALSLTATVGTRYHTTVIALTYGT